VFFPVLPRLPDGSIFEDGTPHLQPILRGSNLWAQAAGRVAASLPNHKLVSVERVMNRYLWDRYCMGAWEIARKNGGAVGELELFHHSKDMDRLIHGTSGGGFDPRMKQVCVHEPIRIPLCCAQLEGGRCLDTG
jgi:hypothetical protein